MVVGSNTSDYLTLTKSNRFKYVFCDINLDYNKEGFDIVKLHKKRKLKSKIVAFTSSNISQELINKHGFDFFLEKKMDHLSTFLKNISITAN